MEQKLELHFSIPDLTKSCSSGNGVEDANGRVRLKSLIFAVPIDASKNKEISKFTLKEEN